MTDTTIQERYESEPSTIPAPGDDSLSEFTARNRQEVTAFLRDNSFLVALVQEAGTKIKRHFPKSQLLLETVSDPKGIEPDKLFLYIATDESPKEARPKLRAFDKEWWLTELKKAHGKLCISLEYL
jgi:hypothetical protein